MITLDEPRSMRSFEKIFNVPPTHRLVMVRSRSTGAAMEAHSWAHDEFDDWGELTARYESFAEVDSRTGALRSGWRKYDSSGRLIDSRRAPS